MFAFQAVLIYHMAIQPSRHMRAQQIRSQALANRTSYFAALRCTLPFWKDLNLASFGGSRTPLLTS